MAINYFSEITLEALIQYIEGTTDLSVKNTVESWIGSDPNHATFFNKVKAAWLDLENIKNFNDETIDHDWKAILTQIDSARKSNADEPIQNTPERILKPWMYAAASVLLIISLVGSYFLGNASGKADDNIPIVYNEIVVPLGEKSQLTLSDGTKIWVNAGSTLRFPNHFGGKLREVWLNGEAFFDVAKDKSKPFYVRTSDVNIKVLGTKFNVKAYGNENVIETTLMEGLISLEDKHDKSSTDKQTYLKPNHKAIYFKDESSLVTEKIKRDVSEPLVARKILISKPVKVDAIISWKEGKLVFDDETLEDIAVKLERRYDVIIHIEDEAIKGFRYSGVLKNVSVEQAVKAIQLSSDFRFDLKGNHIYIYKK